MRLVLRLGYLSIPLAFLTHSLLQSHGTPWLRHWEPLLTFLLSGLAVIPLAHLMGLATGQLAQTTGPTWGGLLNATFGNAAELIIAVIAMTKGLDEVVKASLAGSILGNLLLVSGGAMVVGGWRRERQTFLRASAQTNSALLAVAVAGMLFPAIFHFTFQHDPGIARQDAGVSTGTAVVLMAVYGLGLLFTLRTHRHIFSAAPASSPEDPAGLGEGWSIRKSVLVLLLASVLVSLLAELLVGSVGSVAANLGWNQTFVGVILLAIFGNAAEHSTAMILARRNDMDTAMTIVYQSSLQIALFTTPFMVLLSAVFVAGHVGNSHRLDLIFSPIIVAALLVTVGLVVVVGLNAETNWFEGVMLLAVYTILGITFFYIPSPATAGYDNWRIGSPESAPGATPGTTRESPQLQGTLDATARQ